MEQETADNIEGKPRKRKWLTQGCFPLLLGGLIGFAISSWVGSYFPLHTMPVEGTVVILNEEGEVIAHQPTVLLCFSQYASGLFRSDRKRRLHLVIDDSGNFGGKIPNFVTTLFFDTKDGKYAAVVDITPDMPTTGLVVELRPRYTVTGRLVDDTKGTPLANQAFKVDLSRLSDFGMTNPFTGSSFATSEVWHSVEITTDAEGFFTIDNVIPGTEYRLFVRQPGISFFAKSLKMPILQPEQYQEPFNLGDVPVPPRPPRCC